MTIKKLNTNKTTQKLETPWFYFAIYNKTMVLFSGYFGKVAMMPLLFMIL